MGGCVRKNSSSLSFLCSCSMEISGHRCSCNELSQYCPLPPQEWMPHKKSTYSCLFSEYFALWSTSINGLTPPSMLGLDWSTLVEKGHYPQNLWRPKTPKSMELSILMAPRCKIIHIIPNLSQASVRAMSLWPDGIYTVMIPSKVAVHEQHSSGVKPIGVAPFSHWRRGYVGCF